MFVLSIDKLEEKVDSVVQNDGKKMPKATVM